MRDIVEDLVGHLVNGLMPTRGSGSKAQIRGSEKVSSSKYMQEQKENRLQENVGEQLPRQWGMSSVYGCIVQGILSSSQRVDYSSFLTGLAHCRSMVVARHYCDIDVKSGRLLWRCSERYTMEFGKEDLWAGWRKLVTRDAGMLIDKYWDAETGSR